MSLHILAQGTLHKDPQTRTSASGRTFTTCQLRIEADGTTTWASAICFAEDAQAELSRLRAGDACSISGRLKVGIYSKDGSDPRPALDIVATAVVALKPKPRTRQPRQARADGREFDARQAYARTGPAHGAEPDFDDPIPFG